MCRLLLLLAITAAAAVGADIKPGETLPWCRLTLNMASTIDRDPPDLRAFDGWYDAETHLLIAREDVADDRGAFTPAPLDPARIVKVDTAKRTPPMPEKARGIANSARAEKAKRAAK